MSVSRSILSWTSKLFARLVRSETKAEALTNFLSMFEKITFVFAVLVMALGFSIQSLGLSLSRTFLYRDTGTIPLSSTFMAVYIFAFAAFFVFVGIRLARQIFEQRLLDLRADSLLRSVELDNAENHQGFILYLRPFESTNKIHGKMLFHNQPVELETQLAKAARKVAPFVALGLSLEHVGAGRIKTDEANWKKTATTLMNRARLIVLMPATNPGTLWELDQIIARGFIHKTLFLNAPQKLLSLRSQFDQKRHWPVIAQRLEANGVALPKVAVRFGRLIYFGDSKTPLIKKPVHLWNVWGLRSVISSAMEMSKSIERERQARL